MKKFKTLLGHDVDDLIDYVKEYVNINKDTEVIIGSDSQSYGKRKTVYGVVVVLYNEGKGGHVICRRENKPKQHDLSMRLIEEVWYSIEVATAIRESGVTVKFIDIDINSDPKFKSNKVFEQATGMVKGMGFDVRHKQSGAMATFAANHLVRL